jgi:protein TonB
VIGGTPGGTGQAPKFLPPNIGSAQKLAGDSPPFPPSLRRAGVLRVLAKICVSPWGAVDRVTIMKGADPLLDDGVVATVKTWRFRPYTANGAPIPFCYPAMFEFKPQ